MGTVRKFGFVLMIALVLCASAVPAYAAPPVEAPSAAAGAAVESPRSFVRCVLHDIEMLPQAKKFTPREYQQLERILNDASRSMVGVTLEPHAAAVMLGAKIGKFIGYDLVWFIGIMQDCLPKLAQ